MNNKNIKENFEDSDEIDFEINGKNNDIRIKNNDVDNRKKVTT